MFYSLEMARMKESNNIVDNLMAKRREDCLKNLISSNKKEGEENENKIIIAVAEGEPAGTKQEDIIFKTKLSHTTIKHHLENLILRGTITKKNKQEKYHLTSQAAKNVTLQSMVFSQESVREIMNSFTHFMSSIYSKEYKEDAIKEIEIRNRLSN